MTNNKITTNNKSTQPKLGKFQRIIGMVKFTTSRILYFCLGIAMAIALYTAQAGHRSVTSGANLTTSIWNDLLSELSSKDIDSSNIGSQSVSYANSAGSANSVPNSVVKNYIYGNCFVCIGWGDFYNQYDETSCAAFGGGWANINTGGTVDDNDEFGVRVYCN